MKANVDLDQIPDEAMGVFVGRVVRTDREGYHERIVQIQTNYPQEIAGRILGCSFYHPIKKGDKVVIAGQLSNDFIESILVRNLSAKSDKPGGSADAEVGLGKYGRKSLVIASPVVLKARMQIDAALKLYEEAAKVTTFPAEPQKIGPSEFEILVADLLERLGFQNVMISGGAGDKGVDVEASRVEEVSGKLSRVIVQCKHQTILNRVMPTQVRDFAHVIQREKQNGVSRGYFVTSSYFSPQCYDKENCGDDMELIDREELEILLKKVGLPLPAMQ